MSYSSFQFRDPLNRSPYVSDSSSPVLYPYARWSTTATSPALYVYGKQVPFRSYFPEDVNLSARPISRVIAPSVLDYTSLTPGCSNIADTGNSYKPSILPNNRFAALYPGQNIQELQYASLNAPYSGLPLPSQVGGTQLLVEAPSLSGAQVVSGQAVPNVSCNCNFGWVFFLALILAAGAFIIGSLRASK